MNKFEYLLCGDLQLTFINFMEIMKIVLTILTNIA